MPLVESNVEAALDPKKACEFSYLLLLLFRIVRIGDEDTRRALVHGLIHNSASFVLPVTFRGFRERRGDGREKHACIPGKLCAFPAKYCWGLRALR
jgi:hypothetical protein